MMVLGIDTSGVVCAGTAMSGVVLSSGVVPDTRAHAEQLMPLIQQVVAEAGLGGLTGYDAIAVGVGPGPFTGLRVGVVTAITLGEALGIPVHGYCSLDVLALQAVTSGVVSGHSAARPSALPAEDAGLPGDFIVAADARRKEWYWATYHADGSRASGPFVTAPEGLPDLPRVGPVTGTAIDLDAGLLAAICYGLITEDGHVFTVPEAGLEPLYLRRPDAEVPTVRKSTLLPPRLAPRRVR